MDMGSCDCASLLRYTSEDGTTNIFVNDLFLSTVHSKEKLTKALATNRVPISGLTLPEQETLMAIVLSGLSELKDQQPISDRNGSTFNIHRVEPEDKGIYSLGSSFVELVIANESEKVSRYVCICVRPKQHAAMEVTAIEDELVDFEFTQQGGEEDDEMRNGDGDHVLEVLEI